MVCVLEHLVKRCQAGYGSRNNCCAVCLVLSTSLFDFLSAQLKIKPVARIRIESAQSRNSCAVRMRLKRVISLFALFVAREYENGFA